MTHIRGFAHAWVCAAILAVRRLMHGLGMLLWAYAGYVQHNCFEKQSKAIQVVRPATATVE
jgi:hypothetical protein